MSYELQGRLRDNRVVQWAEFLTVCAVIVWAIAW